MNEDVENAYDLGYEVGFDDGESAAFFRLEETRKEVTELAKELNVLLDAHYIVPARLRRTLDRLAEWPLLDP